MATTAIATLQPVWDCRWSRPGHRLTGVSDTLQPESRWVCVREGQRRNLREDECHTCPDWELSPGTTVSLAEASATEASTAITSNQVLAMSLRVVLVLMAVSLIAIGVTILTRPLAIPFTIGLWMGAAAMIGAAVFARLNGD
jgi:hypothetical protein